MIVGNQAISKTVEAQVSQSGPIVKLNNRAASKNNINSITNGNSQTKDGAGISFP
jgi:hypothetical protein